MYAPCHQTVEVDSLAKFVKFGDGVQLHCALDLFVALFLGSALKRGCSAESQLMQCNGVDLKCIAH